MNLNEIKMIKNFTKTYFNNGLRWYGSATAVKHKLQSKQIGKQLPYITCKRSEFNLILPASDEVKCKFGTIPLASKGWLHYKSKADYFSLNATISEEELKSEMQDLGDFSNSTKLHFNEKLVENLNNELNITKLTSIQSQGIPKIYDPNHVLVAAETGCGKTLVYLLPIVQRILERKLVEHNQSKQRNFNTPLVVIITPGRELATQISEVAKKLCTSTDVKVKLLVGGNTKSIMMNPNFEDVDIVVATIGALSKLVATGIYRMEEVRHVILDEADCLLDDSFSDKLCYFLKRFPFHRNYMKDDKIVGSQLVLASATMPTNIEERLKEVINVQTLKEVVSNKLHKLMPNIGQKFLRMAKADRPARLLNVVKAELSKNRPIVIFSNKSATSDYISIFLNNNGLQTLNLNGDMLMKIRMGRFESFQNGECNILSTTDVGSRGLDTSRARHVINFDFPLHMAEYIHRCGRIGRVSSMHKGLVTNFISSRREVSLVQRIEHVARTGGLLPDVNANIKGIINKRIMDDMNAAGIQLKDETLF